MIQQGSTLLEAHNQWANRPADQRFQTLEALRAAVHARRLRSRSTDIERQNVVAEATDDGGIIINRNVTPCAPSHWAFGQLCAASKIRNVSAPASYLRTLPAKLAVACLNEGLRGGDREAHKFMTIASEDDTPHTLQAVTSTTYGRIWDADVADCVQRVVERSGGKFHNPLAYAGGRFGGSPVPSGLYASDHDIFVFMIDGGSILEAGPRAQFNRGFMAWNSETGARTFGLCTFAFNSCCGNHYIYGARDLQQSPRGHRQSYRSPCPLASRRRPSPPRPCRRSQL